jgi:hypothetical protein
LGVFATVAMGETLPELGVIVVRVARVSIILHLLPWELHHHPRKLVLSSVGSMEVHRHWSATAASAVSVIGDRKWGPFCTWIDAAWDGDHVGDLGFAGWLTGDELRRRPLLLLCFLSRAEIGRGLSCSRGLAQG